MIGLDPAEGVVHERFTPLKKKNGVEAVSVGAPGSVATLGVAYTSFDFAPSLTEFVALTWYQYVVPFVTAVSV